MMVTAEHSPQQEFIVMAGALTFCVAGVVGAISLWPRLDQEPITHDHPDLPPDHPHLTGSGPHAHPIIIDDLHRDWPMRG